MAVEVLGIILMLLVREKEGGMTVEREPGIGY